MNVTSEEKAASKEGLKKDYGREVLRLAPKEKPLTSRVDNEASSSRLRMQLIFLQSIPTSIEQQDPEDWRAHVVSPEPAYGP